MKNNKTVINQPFATQFDSFPEYFVPTRVLFTKCVTLFPVSVHLFLNSDFSKNVFFFFYKHYLSFLTHFHGIGVYDFSSSFPSTSSSAVSSIVCRAMLVWKRRLSGSSISSMLEKLGFVSLRDSGRFCKLRLVDRLTGVTTW